MTNRLLKDTGSLFLPCDPTKSHNLKLLPGARLPLLAPINRRAPCGETRSSHKCGARGTLI